jgi:cyclopropane fatty-acyl-phospholipid synthase-like methyltransferase
LIFNYYAKMTWLRKLFFELSYLGSPRWDTGISPPELYRFIDEKPPGRALDLGCGTGTNLVTLVKAGWEASGVDFSHLAVRFARRKLRRAGVRAAVVRDDVSRLTRVSGPYDLILDMGCFHSLADNQLDGYAQGIGKTLAPNGTYLLFVYFREPGAGPPGTTEALLAQAFANLELAHREEGRERDSRGAAWLWYRRPAS